MNYFKCTAVFMAIVLTIGAGNPAGTEASPQSASNESRLETIQAARNYNLAEQEFMHDFDEKLTRQELAMLVVKMLEKLSYKNIGAVAQAMQIFYSYDDRPLPSQTYAPYIYLASKLGIVSSMSQNKFYPYGIVTRGMYATVLLRAMILARPFSACCVKDDVKFADDGKIYDWARAGIVFAYKSNYMDVNSKNEINPRGYVTRIQALDAVYRVLVKEKAVDRLAPDVLKRARGELPLYLKRSADLKWGYADGMGNFIIKPQFDDAGSFSECLAAVRLNNKWGFIDTSGNIVAKPDYERVHEFHEGTAAVSAGNKFGYIDNTGKLVIKLQYLSDYDFLTRLSDFNSGRAIVKLDNNKYRLIDKTGKSVLKNYLTSARPFSEGLAAVTIDGRRAYIDTSGKTAIRLEPEVTYAGDFCNGTALICINNSTYRYIDKKGRFVTKSK